MAITYIVGYGAPMTMVQNEVYALPAKVGRIQALSVLEISPDGSTWDTLTSSDTVGADVAAGFVRSTGANNICCWKPY